MSIEAVIARNNNALPRKWFKLPANDAFSCTVNGIYRTACSLFQ